MMAKKYYRMKRILAVCMSVLLVATMAYLPAEAKTGQEQVHIHHVGGITKNKGTVTIEMPDGSTLTGTLTGSTLTFDMDSTENGFDIGKDESLKVPYTTGDGKSGELTITHKEGNGTNIGDEHDQGLNNYNGKFSTGSEPEPEPEPEPDP